MQSVALLAALGALNGVNSYEKWDVDKESAGFLASVVTLGKDDGSPMELRDIHVDFRDLKVMEPLLHCDPDLELQQLRRRNQVNISPRGIAPIPLQEGEGDVFRWSSCEHIGEDGRPRRPHLLLARTGYTDTTELPRNTGRTA